METIKTFLTSTAAKRFYWQTANGFVGLLITYLAQINWAYAPLVIAGLNFLTKELNNKFGNIK